MAKKWTHWNMKLFFTKLILIIYCSCGVTTCETSQNIAKESEIDKELKHYLDDLFSENNFYIVPGVRVEEFANVTKNDTKYCESGRSARSVEDYFQEKLDRYAKTHLLSVNVLETARFLSSSGGDAAAAATGGKSSFLAGFGMGFLAFALKKLMLPVFIGAQLIKSVLIAMFLPSILGGLGKIVGKGLSTFSGISGASTGLNSHNQNQLEEFEFKDTDPYNNEQGVGNDLNEEAEATNQLSNVDLESSTLANANSRFGFAHQRISYVQPQNDNYYLRRPATKKTDYKVFHKIPSSSLLLTSYDPFYSPLLSRLDAIFQQLGLGNGKSAETERCRERVVCLMYANPAKYAPYSNLVSAQLSRELNELRKPSSDNPDILRFFRYMKAAKDGQDGEECQAHGGCPSLTAQQPSPAMLTTYNDINKYAGNGKTIWGWECPDLWPPCGNIRNDICSYENCNVNNSECREILFNLEIRKKIIHVINSWRHDRATEFTKNISFADMMSISYSLELEYVAICHANRCSYSSGKCHSTVKYSSVAVLMSLLSTEQVRQYTLPNQVERGLQSMFSFQGKETIIYLQEILKNIDSYKESDIIDYEYYSQLIWGKTNLIGCALSIIKGEKSTNYLVCSFAPAGNVRGEKILTVGNPGSQCPGGIRNSYYSGLCGEIDDSQTLNILNPWREEEFKKLALNSATHFTLFATVHFYCLIEIYVIICWM